MITFSISSTMDYINTSFVLLQNRSLLISQQTKIINTLIATLISMFNIEMIPYVW